MGIFDKVLASDGTVFKNDIALNYDFIPKLIPHRENQQFKVASCIKPLFAHMNGRNMIISGLPGIGKTVATRKVLDELEEQTDDIIPIYVNCWQKGTSYKVFLEICEQLDYKFTQNKRTEELLSVIGKLLNTKAAVFVFDEIDKAEDPNFIYSLIEEVHYKSIICITNYKSWTATIDKRIMSRFMPETIEFHPYNKNETADILKSRVEQAFFDGAFTSDALQLVTDKTYEVKDIRTGLYVLKEAGLAAEERSSKTIEVEDVKTALGKIPDFKIKDIDELGNEEQVILEIIKKNSPARIGDLFKIYEDNGGKGSYKTFQRKVGKLEENKFISIKKQIGGAEGTTSMISYESLNKTLSDFE